MSTQFVLANTRLTAVALTPEVHLRLADEAIELWQRTESDRGGARLPPPFWAFAWAGGQALARYLLDNPALVAGRRVLDRMLGFLLRAAAKGASVLAGDPGRAYVPWEHLTLPAQYDVPVPQTLEDTPIKRTTVWSVNP